MDVSLLKRKHDQPQLQERAGGVGGVSVPVHGVWRPAELTGRYRVSKSHQPLSKQPVAVSDLKVVFSLRRQNNLLLINL